MSSSSKKSQTGSPIESSAMSECFSKEQEKFLPIANVNRIMKKSLPGNAKISKEAKETVQECVSEFISFITGEASDKCHREKRKTINGDDLLWAMTTLGFESYVGPLKAYLNKYREIEGEKSQMSRQDQNQNQSPKTNSTNATESNNDIIVSVGAESNNISHLHVTNKLDFQEFNNNGVLYSLCGQVNNPKSYEEVSGNNNMVNIGYGESNSYGNNVGTNYSVDGIKNASTAMASHLQHGIGW